MANISQVQRGAANFIDRHLAGSYSGFEKAIVLGGAALVLNNLPKTIERYQDHPFNILTGIYDKESGNIDLDSAYQVIAPYLGAEKIPITLPSLGKINLGTIKLGKAEIEELIRCIREA